MEFGFEPAKYFQMVVSPCLFFFCECLFSNVHSIFVLLCSYRIQNTEHRPVIYFFYPFMASVYLIFKLPIYLTHNHMPSQQLFLYLLFINDTI